MSEKLGIQIDRLKSLEEHHNNSSISESKKNHLHEVIEQLEQLHQNEKRKRDCLGEILQKAKNQPASKKLVIFRDKIVKDVPTWVIETLDELIKSQI